MGPPVLTDCWPDGEARWTKCACGRVIEPDRLAARMPTCWECAGAGCGADFADGQPVVRCDGCDCQLARLDEAPAAR